MLYWARRKEFSWFSWSRSPKAGAECNGPYNRELLPCQRRRAYAKVDLTEKCNGERVLLLQLQQLAPVADVYEGKKLSGISTCCYTLQNPRKASVGVKKETKLEEKVRKEMDIMQLIRSQLYRRYHRGFYTHIVPHLQALLSHLLQDNNSVFSPWKIKHTHT